MEAPGVCSPGAFLFLKRTNLTRCLQNPIITDGGCRKNSNAEKHPFYAPMTTTRRSGQLWLRRANPKSIAGQIFFMFLGQRSTKLSLRAERKDLPRGRVPIIVFAALNMGSSICRKLAIFQNIVNEKPNAKTRPIHDGLVYFDTKRPPLIKGKDQTLLKKNLFVAIDNYPGYCSLTPPRTRHKTVRNSL